MSSTVIPPEVRRLLSMSPDVGAGNALRAALDVSPDPDAAYLFLERPVRGVSDEPVAELSLRQLGELVDAWTHWYIERGVGPRDRVGVFTDDGGEDLIHYLAAARVGAIPVLVNGGMNPNAALDHFGRTGVVGVIADAAHRTLLNGTSTSADHPFWLACLDDVVLSDAGRSSAAYRHDRTDPVLICHSSGTTGIPKAVVWTHGQAFAGVASHLRCFPDSPESVILSALPQSHASAIGYAILAMLSGVPLVLMSDRTGAAVAAAADRYAATTVVGFASTFADLATRCADGATLATVERWVSVGDANHQAHVAELVRRGRHWERGKEVPGSMFIDGFGASELGWGGVLSSVTVSGVVPAYRCLGRPQPFADVVVLRPDGTTADPHEVGLLGVKGDTITPGYWNDSDLSYRSTQRGYWLCGDLVYRDEQNRFYHVDRALDAIQTRAGIVYSVLTEEILLAHLPELADCSVIGAAIDGETCAIAVAQVRPGADARDLLPRANETLAKLGKPRLARIDVTDPEAVPTGLTGKVLKRELRQRYGGQVDAAR